MKYLFQWSLYVQYRDAEEKPNKVKVLNSNMNLIISETTLIKRLSRIVTKRVLKSKVEIVLAFFLAFILINVFLIGT